MECSLTLGYLPLKCKYSYLIHKPGLKAVGRRTELEKTGLLEHPDYLFLETPLAPIRALISRMFGSRCSGSESNAADEPLPPSSSSGKPIVKFPSVINFDVVDECKAAGGQTGIGRKNLPARVLGLADQSAPGPGG